MKCDELGNEGDDLTQTTAIGAVSSTEDHLKEREGSLGSKVGSKVDKGVVGKEIRMSLFLSD